MNILISHVYSSENKGDAAILASQIAELKRVFPHATLDIATLDSADSEQDFDGNPIHNSLMHYVYYSGYPPVMKFLHVLVMSLYSLVWALAWRAAQVNLPLPRNWRKAIRYIQRADLQVAVGGGYLRGKKDLVSTVTLWLLVHQVLMARLLGKPTVFYAQSFGPYFGGVQRFLARLALSSAELILVREGASRATLKDLGIPDKRVHRVADTAFLFNVNRELNVRQYFVQPPERVVGVTVREWLHPAGQERYEKAVAGLLEHIAARGWGVALIPQVTADKHNDDDRLVGRRIKAALQHVPLVVNIEEKLTHHQVKALYSSLDFLVGTRFHSVIFAVSEGVPAVAVEYEHKTSGILNELGLREWCLKIEDVTAEHLIERFDSLVQQEHQVKAHLAEVIPPYRAKAALGADLIQQKLSHRFQTNEGKPSEGPQPESSHHRTASLGQQ